MYKYDDGVLTFNVPNRDRRTVYKCDMNPHYVLCSVDKLNLILYSFDDDGGVSTLLQHWVAFQKIHKEMNKNEFLWKPKTKHILKIYTKINSAYIYLVRIFYQ